MSIASEEQKGFRELAGAVLRHWRAEIAAVLREVLGSGPALTAVVFHGGGNAASVAAAARGATDVAVILPASEVLRPGVRLPRAGDGTLRKALHFELARLSPLDPDALYFDHAVPPGKAGALAELSLRIIRRSTVDGAVALAHAAGLSVAAIGFAGDARPADWRHFPIDRAAFLRTQWRRWSIPALAALALLLLLALLAAAYARGGERAAQLDDLLFAERGRAAAVEHMEREIRRIDSQSAFLTKQKRSPLLVATLADLSQLLPDNTWISQIGMSGAKVRIQGFSRASAALVGLIERSGRYRNAQFVAPLVQAGNTGAERFDMTFEIRP